MARERQLVVQILGDASQAQRALQGFQSSADATASRMSQLGDRFTDVGRRATLFVTLPIVGALGAATKAAADEGKEMAVLANSLKNATGATASQVEATEKWITKTQNATGIADGELRPALGRLVMATKDTEKAQDLLGTAMDVSVARGISLETAATALSKAYLGNTAGLGRLGIATKDAEGNALSFEQVMANLNKTVGGAAASAADTAAGRAAILRARFSDMTEDIGNKLIPVLEKVTGVIGKVFDAFSSLPNGGQQFVVIGALAAAAVGPIASVVGNVIKLNEWLHKGSAPANALGTALKGIGIAGAVVGSVYLLKQGLDALGLAAKGVEVDIKRVAGATRGELVDAFREAEKIGQGQAVFNKILSESVTEAQRLVDGLAAAGIETGKFQRAVDEAVRVEQASAASKQKDTEATLGLSDATEDLTGEVDKEKSAFERTKEAVDAFKSALDEALGTTLSANDAQRQHRENVDALAVAIKENGTQVGFATEKQRALGEAVDAAVESAQREVEALTQDGKIAADNASQKASLILRLEELKNKYPQLSGAIQAHIDKINSVPAEKATTMVVDTGQALSRIDTLLARLRQVTANTRADTGNILANIPGRAHGGPVTAGHAYVVGEQRPELFVPSSNGTIVPRVPAMAGASVTNNYITLNVEGSVVTENDLFEKAHEYLLKKQRRNAGLGLN